MIERANRFLLVAALAAIGGLAACAPSASNTRDDSPSGARHLTILALNDFHGALYESPDRHDPTVAWGGLPWLAGAIEAVRTEVPELLLLDGGDQFQGSWPVNASSGMGATLAMNLLGLDATCVGNHEFDYGPAEGRPSRRGALEAAAAEARFAWLSANIYEADGSRWQPPGFAPWTVIERAGVRVGVIGVSTQETPQTTLYENVSDLRFEDPAVAVREGVEAVRAEGAEVIVVIGHILGACPMTDTETLGQACTPDDEIAAILDAVPPGTIDVLIAGHEHAVMFNRVGDTFVMANAAHGRYLGRVDLVVGPDGVDADASVLHSPWAMRHERVDPGCGEGTFPTEPLEVGGRVIAPNLEALALIERLEVQAGSLCDPIGCADERLGRSSEVSSPLGNFAADAMIAAMPAADFALTNSGGLRADLQAGVVRREDIQAVMPFENRLLLVEMTGRQVELLLRIGTSGQHGVFQISGGNYRYNPDTVGGTDLDGDGEIALWETDRLCDVQFGNRVLEPDERYRVVITDFIYTGGDHSAPAFVDVPILEEGPLMRDALYEWVEAQQPSCVSPVRDVAPPRVTTGNCI